MTNFLNSSISIKFTVFERLENQWYCELDSKSTQSRSDKLQILDDVSSRLSTLHEEATYIHTDHNTISKFGSVSSPGFDVVCAVIQNYVYRAPKHINSRWNDEMISLRLQINVSSAAVASLSRRDKQETNVFGQLSLLCIQNQGSDYAYDETQSQYPSMGSSQLQFARQQCSQITALDRIPQTPRQKRDPSPDFSPQYRVFQTSPLSTSLGPIHTVSSVSTQSIAYPEPLYDERRTRLLDHPSPADLFLPHDQRTTSLQARDLPIEGLTSLAVTQQDVGNRSLNRRNPQIQFSQGESRYQGYVPGNSLRRSTRTTYRRGSLREEERYGSGIQVGLENQSDQVIEPYSTQYGTSRKQQSSSDRTTQQALLTANPYSVFQSPQEAGVNTEWKNRSRSFGVEVPSSDEKEIFVTPPASKRVKYQFPVDLQNKEAEDDIEYTLDTPSSRLEALARAKGRDIDVKPQKMCQFPDHVDTARKGARLDQIREVNRN